MPLAGRKFGKKAIMKEILARGTPASQRLAAKIQKWGSRKRKRG